MYVKHLFKSPFKIKLHYMKLFGVLLRQIRCNIIQPVILSDDSMPSIFATLGSHVTSTLVESCQPLHNKETYTPVRQN